MLDAKFDSSIFSRQQMQMNRPIMVKLASAMRMISCELTSSIAIFFGYFFASYLYSLDEIPIEIVTSDNKTMT